jgi:acyl-CoA dehydrogenase
VDFDLTPAQRELRDRAAGYVDDVLVPLEVEAELADGALPEETVARVRKEARERGLDAGNHPVELGGRGWSNLEQVVVHEELGRNTNAIWWHMGGAYNVLSRGTPEQIQRYLMPTLRGDMQDAYAVTEAGAGSDAGGIEGTAVRTDGGFRLRAEKWFVTTGDKADFYIVMVNVVEDEARLPTLFLVDRSLPGIEFVEEPRFTHNYPHGHPTIRFDVELGEEAVLGGPDSVGQGDELQNEWFVEERMHIAARCVGAMRRLLDETVEWSLDREQFGSRIFDFQGISFPLADSAADCVAARLMTLHVASMADDPAVDRKLVHAHASMAKLFASEAAWRCADRCVQAFGGRGYMRSNVAERFLRELRVDRIWEGTSEIQRLIVARGLERRGVARLLLA